MVWQRLLALAVGAGSAACSFQPGALRSDASQVQGDVPDIDGMPDGTAAVTSPRRLVFDTSTLGSTQLLVPVMVALDASTIDYAAVADPTTDLKFEDPLSTLSLPFEVERWDETGTSIVWVRIPGLVPATPTSILMHFGAGVGSANPALTWAGYELVHHLDASLTSSAATTYGGTAVNVAFGPAKIGHGAQIADGTIDRRITFASSGALFDSWAAFSLELWLYPDYANAAAVMASGEPRFVDKGGALNLGRLFSNGTDVTAQIDLHFTGGSNDVYLNTNVAVSDWTHLVYTFDGARVRIYKNGALARTSAPLSSGSQTTIAGTQEFYLGGSSNPMAGMLDELRIERSARPLDWIATQYKSMTGQLVTITDP